MKASTTTSTVETPATSNRRQPLRQTRTNPARNATSGTRPFGGQGTAAAVQDNDNAAPGFFPAITHFTDAITALPKEMIRHYTMLKEVDAKIYGPEDALKQLVTTALRTPIPPVRKATVPIDINGEFKSDRVASTTDSFDGTGIANGSAQGESTLPISPSGGSDLLRRKLFQQLRMVMQENIMTLEEKTHVMFAATDALDKQLVRCQGSYPHIEGEISEEARYGNLHHWAYTHKTTEKKGTTANERTRREAALATNHVRDLSTIQQEDIAAIRSEARREAIAARKQRNHHVDSDFDDGRGGQAGPRKTAGTGKGRKATESGSLLNGTPLGLGLLNASSTQAPNGPNKRRKIERPVTSNVGGGLPMERSMSGVFGSSAAGTRGGAISPRETPAVEAAKKRARGPAAINGHGRRRAGTNTSAINSPSMASSPVVGTFNITKDPGNSPNPNTMPRVQSSRARQNSTQNNSQDPLRNRPPSSASVKHTNGNGVHNGVADVDKVATITGKGGGDVKNPVKETINSKGEHLIESAAEGSGELRGGLLVGSRSQEKSLKREETENSIEKSHAHRPPSISTSTRGGKSSKTATPVNASFSEPQRPRSSRALETTIKRSHKKGAGIAAQLAAAAAVVADEDGSSVQGDEEEEEDDSEPRYCYCNQVSYGEMVACDSEQCKLEWFHLSCAGLSKAPTKNAKWYCEECLANMKKGKSAPPIIR